MQKDAGFTLIELMIVIAIIAAIALPDMLRARIQSNIMGVPPALPGWQ